MAGPYQRLSNGQSADSGAQAITTVVNAIEAGLEDAEATITAQAALISGKAATGHNHDTTYDASGTAATAYSLAIQRGYHTGTQTSSTISDFNTAVRTNRLDQLAAPTTAVGMGSQRITGLGTPSASTDAATKAYVDSAGPVTTATFDRLFNAYVNGSTAAPATMSSPPTLALSAAGAATAVSGAVTVAPNDSAFTYLGASMSNVGTLGSFSNCYRQNSATLTNTGQVGAFLNVEFETDDDDFEVIFRSEDTTYARYRVWVNGEPAAAHAQVGTSGSYYRLRVTFASSTARRIRVEGQAVSFCGIAKRATRTIWATVRDTGPVCVAVTDSYGVNWDGATASTLWVWDNYVVRAGRYLGWNVYPSPVGGTGFTATNSGSNVKFGSRLTTDVTNLAPEIVVVAGSVNDQGLTLATVQSDISSYFSSLRTALPNATIYGIGGVTPRDTYNANMATIEGYISTACTANTATYVASTDWINGTGYSGATTGVGNSDFYTAADGYHLVAAGYTYVAERLVGAIGAAVGRRAR